MNIYTHLLTGEQTGLSVRNRRHLRLRNHLTRNRYLIRIAFTAEALRDLIATSLNKGGRAVRQIAIPATAIQLVMLTMAISYFTYPPALSIFQHFVDFKNHVGDSFSFLSLGFIAVFAEFLRRLSTRDWTGFSGSASYGFVVFGLLGITTDCFYSLQKVMWGGLSPSTQIVAKVLTDQFIYTVLFANPYQTLLYVFKDCGFRPQAFKQRLSPFKMFYVREVLAVLITNWAFWIPTTAILYSLPLDLQFVISRLAITIWVLLLSAMTKRD